ncbi:MAG: lysophospholipid acyltransferase family protein [Bacteroidota bacterium]
MLVWSFFTGLKLEIEGAHNISKDKTYVFIANHTNLLDVLLVGSALQHPYKPLAKYELWDLPLIGKMIDLVSVPVNRSDAESRLRSFHQMVHTLKRGISILVFPEGTRNLSNNPLLPFKNGAFRMAIDAQVPIVPISLLNVRSLHFKGTLLVKPGTITLKYLSPIPTEGLTPENLSQLRRQVYQAMQADILANDPWFQSLHRPKLSF